MPDAFVPEPLPPQETMPSAPESSSEESSESRVERAPEQAQERVSERQEPVAQPATAPVEPAAAVPPPAAPVREKDEFHLRIEQVLEEDMEDVLKDLTPAKREEFRVAKEETAAKIRDLLDQVAVHFTAVLLLIRNWLMLIPGVNRFFLEQESKIKTDKIKRIADEIRTKRLS